MKGWAIVCVVLCGLASGQEHCIEVSADPGPQSPVVKGLDLALQLSADLLKATLCLSLSETPFTVARRITVNTEVEVLGNAQVLNVLTTVEVRGSLSLFNVTLKTSLSPAESSILLLNEGFLLIQDSSVESFETTLITGFGEVIFERVNFSQNAAPIVSINKRGNTSVKVLQCSVRCHFGEFLDTLPSVDFGRISVSIEQSSFRENAGTGFLISCEAPLLPGTFTIIDTEFLLNSILLLYFDISDFRVSITRSTFLDNSQSTITVNAKESVFTMEDSLWRLNSNIVFDFRQFTGDIIATRITVDYQRWKGVFQVRNSLSPPQCRFTINESLFRHIYFKVDEPSLCLISAYGCMIQISQTLINDVRCAATRQRYMEALIVERMGDISISQLTLYSSGSPGAGIALGFGNLKVVDSFLYDVQSGANAYIVSTIGSLYAKNVSISHGAGFPLDDVNGGSAPSYISAMTSDMEVTDVKIIPGPMAFFDFPRLLLATHSNVNVSNITIDGYELGAVGGFFDTVGLMRNITILNCFLSTVFYVENYELLRIVDVVVSNTLVNMYDFNGFFYSSPTMNIECSNFTIHNVTTSYFTASKKSQIRLFSFTISNSYFGYLFKYQLDSYVSIEKMTFRHSTGAIASLYQSSLLIIDSLFEKLVSGSFILEGDNADITLDNVAMNNVFSPFGVSSCKEKSNLTISQSVFEDLQITADGAFFHNTGIFTFTESSFRFFNAMFIQARNCSVHITSSVFQEGRSKALSQTSDTAYGGALGCVDCTSVVIEHSSFFNVSAIFGGAIAVRSPSNLESLWIHVANCEFVMCSASAGGAIYVKQSSLILENSQFIGNKATLAGGAIDTHTSIEESARIRNCVFYRNSANEGGAIKWHDAEVTFVNTTFQDNSAVYGPDIASYGIKLSGSVISNGTEASGYPLQLIFEFQDHYGQRVTTASAQVLQLVKNDPIDFFGNTVSIIDHGIFNFSRLTVYAQPNSTQTVLGTLLTTRSQVVIGASVNITFRDCVPGEVRRKDRCEYCFASNVSFYPSDSNCNYCPKHAFCPGGNVLIVDPYYWRSSTDSIDLVPCPLRENCLGGEFSDCAEGYTGKLCNECSEDYTRIRSLECEHCGSRIVQWVKVLFAVVPFFGFYVVVINANETQFFILKVIINHAQLLSILGYFRVSYPPVIKYFYHSLSYISSLFITDLPISCFSSRYSEYLKAIIGSALSPSLYLFFILASRRNLKKAWVLCTSASMFTSTISLVTQMPLLTCQSLHTGTEYLFIDMKERCWEGLHLLLINALLVPSVILNVLLPILLVIVVSITSPQKFDDLFPLWRSGANWACWDLLTYCGKGVLACFVIVSMTAGQLSQVTYGLLVLIIVSISAVSASSYAYTHWKWFVLAEFSLVIVAVSMGLCAFFIYNSPSGGAVDWLIVAVLLVLNVGFCAVCVKMWKLQIIIEKQQSHVEIEVSREVMGELVVPHNSVIDFQGSRVLP